MNHTCCQFHANFVVGSTQMSEHGTICDSTEWFSRESLATFDGRVIFFNSMGDSCWEYGIVHFRGANTVVNIAVNYAEHSERTHSAIYPFHYQAQPGFIFRAASLEEYEDLCFSYEDFSADPQKWQIDCI